MCPQGCGHQQEGKKPHQKLKSHLAPGCGAKAWKLLVAQSCPTLCKPRTSRNLPAPLFMEFSRQEYWSGLPCRPSSRGSFVAHGWNMGFPNGRQILHHLSHQGNPERKVSNDRRYSGGDQEFIMESSLQGKSRGQKFDFGELRPHSWRAAQAPHN